MARRARCDDERAFDLAVGERIAQQRKARRIGGTALARAVGMSQQHLYLVECGRRCSPLMLARIASVLRVDVRALLPESQQLVVVRKIDAPRG